MTKGWRWKGFTGTLLFGLAFACNGLLGTEPGEPPVSSDAGGGIGDGSAVSDAGLEGDVTSPKGDAGKDAVVDLTDAGWNPMTSGTTEPLQGIWGSSSSDVYIVGGKFQLTNLILHSGGNGVWTTSLSTTGQGLYAVWGSGPNDIYAVGAGGTILHSTGNGVWTPQTSNTTQLLTAVWGRNAQEVYVVGAGGTILRSNGNGTWVKETSTEVGMLEGVWGAGPTDVYVIGHAVILKSNGNGTWSAESAPGVDHHHGIWGSSASDIYVVGANAQGNGPAIHHGTGKEDWAYSDSTAIAKPIVGIWGSGPKDIFVVTQNDILHSDGDGKWTRQPNSATPFKIWGSGPADVYVVGPNGGIFHRP